MLIGNGITINESIVVTCNGKPLNKLTDSVKGNGEIIDVELANPPVTEKVSNKITSFNSSLPYKGLKDYPEIEIHGIGLY